MLEELPKPLRSIRYGEEMLPAGHDLARHQHFEAYATVVLKGSFEQVGYAGRFVVGPGDILIQPTLDSHASRMLSSGVHILRLPWHRDPSFGGVYRGLDVDSIRRAAAVGIDDAALCMRQFMAGRPLASGLLADWEDIVAQRMRAQPNLCVQGLAKAMRLSREALSRGFKRCYGASPVTFRTDMRAREAWMRVTSSCDALSAIAMETGFADQSHMTRAIQALTHDAPSAWRKRCGVAVGQTHSQLCSQIEVKDSKKYAATVGGVWALRSEWQTGGSSGT
jgi:AraC-like DNA-binding protein